MSVVTDSIEFAEQRARPFELFLFETEGKSWRYCNADRDYTSLLLGGTFDPWAVSRSEISQTEEIKKLTVKIAAPRTIPLYEHFRVAAPSKAVAVTIYTVHQSPLEYDAEDTILPEWSGRVLGPRRTGDTVEFLCEPIFTSIKVMGLRRCWQRQCPLVLYSQGLGKCNVDPLDFRVSAVVTAISGNTVTALEFAGLSANYLEGGYLEWEPRIDGIAQVGAVDYRTIEVHEGGVITLARSLTGLEVGQSVYVYPGCDHTMTMCNARFGNILNYGGQPYIPQKNPYKGQPVY